MSANLPCPPARALPPTWRPRRAAGIGGMLPLPPDAGEVEVPAEPDVRQAAFGSENGIVLLARTTPGRAGGTPKGVRGDSPEQPEQVEEGRCAQDVAGATAYVTRTRLARTPAVGGGGPEPLYVGTVDVLLPDGSTIFATALGPTRESREQLLAAIAQLRLDP